MFGMLIIDSFIYFIIAVYLENVVPSEYGIKRKWYFPIAIEFWFIDRKMKNLKARYSQISSEENPVSKASYNH